MGRPRRDTSPTVDTDGFCACGCGQQTPISDRYQSKNGVFVEKGQHFRYLPGHRKQPSLEERFWQKVDKRKSNECWNWQGSFNNGYGRLSFKDKNVAMHRYSYELAHGSIPDGMQVLHRCGNKACVNPAHLYAGTSAENNRDTVVHGHSKPRRGSDTSMAKVTEDDVRAIRAEYATGKISMMAIGKRYGIASETVWCIVRHKHWKHVL